MNKIACLLVAVSLCGTCFAQNANTTPVGANTKTVTITGTIKNFDEFKAVVVPETYIQLVPLPSDGVVWTTTKFVKGKPCPFFDSDLVKLSVPKKAAFSFRVINTPPGRYFLAAQRLNLEWIKASEGPVFLTEKEVVFIIDVPADAKSPHTINAGDLIVRIH